LVKSRKIFSKYLNKWNQIPFEGEALISTIMEDESYGSYYITNGLTKKYKDLYITSSSLDYGIYEFQVKHGKFYVSEDYYLKYSSMSTCKMKLFDKNNSLICNIVLSESLGIFLEKNNTNFDILLAEDDSINIVSKSYASKFKEGGKIDADEIIADIEWDILEKTSNLGVAKLNIYEDTSDNEFDILIAFAASTFLLFRSYINGNNALIAMNGIRANYRNRK